MWKNGIWHFSFQHIGRPEKWVCIEKSTIISSTLFSSDISHRMHNLFPASFFCGSVQWKVTQTFVYLWSRKLQRFEFERRWVFTSSCYIIPIWIRRRTKIEDSKMKIDSCEYYVHNARTVCLLTISMSIEEWSNLHVGVLLPYKRDECFFFLYWWIDQRDVNSHRLQHLQPWSNWIVTDVRIFQWTISSSAFQILDPCFSGTHSGFWRIVYRPAAVPTQKIHLLFRVCIESIFMFFNFFTTHIWERWKQIL